MKAFFTLVAICSSSSILISATPTRLINLAVKNELNGKTATAVIRADGRFKRFPDLFENSALDENGTILGTSAQLVRSFGEASCTIRSSFGDFVLNHTEPIVDLDGNPNVALLEPLILSNFRIRCDQ